MSPPANLAAVVLGEIGSSALPVGVVGAVGYVRMTCTPTPPSGGLTNVAVVHPDAVAVVAGPALHDIVGVVRLCHLVVGVNDNLGAQEHRDWGCFC